MSVWQPPPRVDVKVGDIVLSPTGEEQRVTEVDLMRDVIVTSTGETWGMEDLEATPRPDLKSPEDVERWLRIAGQIIPRLAVQYQNVVCSCDCSACYRVDMWETTRATNEIRNFRSSHFHNNNTCQCVEEGCSCLS